MEIVMKYIKDTISKINEKGKLLGLHIEGHERFWRINNNLSSKIRNNWIYVIRISLGHGGYLQVNKGQKENVNLLMPKKCK